MNKRIILRILEYYLNKNKLRSMDIYEGAMTVLTHIGTNQIETEKLILRRFKYTDNESMLSHWVGDHEIQSMYSELVYRTNEEVRVLLNKYISSYDKDD